MGESINNRQCPRCTGTLFPEGYGYHGYSCLQCGAQITTDANNRPAPQKGRKRVCRSQKYFDDHRQEILRDLQELGLKGMFAKWNISYATWYTECHGKPQGIAARWGLSTSYARGK